MSASPPRPLSIHLVELLTDRLDVATANGKLVLSVGEYAAILEAMFPETFGEPAPPEPDTATLPGTPARASVMWLRARKQRGLRHTADRIWDDRTVADPHEESPADEGDSGRWLWRVTWPDGRTFSVRADNKTQAKRRCRSVCGYRGRNAAGVLCECLGPARAA